MKNIKKIIIPTLLIMTCFLSGCSKEDLPDEKFAAVPKLYMETLVRELSEADTATLELCSEEVQLHIKNTSEEAQKALRKYKYLTKEEAAEIVGPLDVYYQDKRKEYLSMQSNGVDTGDTGSSIEEYTPVKILTQDTYEVLITGMRRGEIVLEDGFSVNFTLPKKYEGEAYITLLDYYDGIYKYSAILEDTEVWIYLDVDDGKVVRLKETLPEKNI